MPECGSESCADDSAAIPVCRESCCLSACYSIRTERNDQYATGQADRDDEHLRICPRIDDCPSGRGRKPQLAVRHRYDVKLCENPAHLELGTQAENTADMGERGGRGIPSKPLTDNECRV